MTQEMTKEESNALDFKRLDRLLQKNIRRLTKKTISEEDFKNWFFLTDKTWINSGNRLVVAKHAVQIARKVSC